MALVHIVAKRWLGTARIYDVKAQEYVGGFSLDADIAINLPAGRYMVELSEVDGYVGESVSFTVADFFSTVRVEWLAEVVVLWEDRNKFINTTYTAGARFDIYVKEGQAFAALTEGNAVPMIDSALFVTQGLFAVISVIVNEAGTGIRILFTRAATQGMCYDPSFFKIKSTTNDDRALVYVDGNGTLEWEFSCEDGIMQDEIVTLDYTPESLNTINDAYGNELQPFIDLVVQNGSGVNTPLVQNPTVDVTGTSLTLLFNKIVVVLDYKVGDLALSIGATVIYPVYVSGSGTQSLTFSLSPLVVKDAIPVLAYNGRPDGIEDQLDNDLAAFSGMSVINDSEEAYPDIVLWSGFEGTITGTTYEATNYDYPAFHSGVVESNSINVTPSYRVVGEKCLYFNNSTANAYLGFGPMSTVRGRVGLWWRPVKLLTGRPIVTLTGDVSSYKWSLGIQVGDTADVVTIKGRCNGTEWLSVGYSITLPYALVLMTAYFIELSWDYETGVFNIFIGGGLVGTITKVSTLVGTFTHVFPGRSFLIPTAPNMAADNLIISTDQNRDLYALALLEAFPRV